MISIQLFISVQNGLLIPRLDERPESDTGKYCIYLFQIKDLEDQVKQMEEDAMHVDNSAEMDRSVDYVVTSGVVMKLNAIGMFRHI